MPPMPSVSPIVCCSPYRSEVAQRGVVAADLHHVDHEVGSVDRTPAVDVRRDLRAGA
jgi:hypothetical protein